VDASRGVENRAVEVDTEFDHGLRLVYFITDEQLTGARAESTLNSGNNGAFLGAVRDPQKSEQHAIPANAYKIVQAFSIGVANVRYGQLGTAQYGDNGLQHSLPIHRTAAFEWRPHPGIGPTVAHKIMWSNGISDIQALLGRLRGRCIDSLPKLDYSCTAKGAFP
jgi:hypothetical protein